MAKRKEIKVGDSINGYTVVYLNDDTATLTKDGTAGHGWLHLIKISSVERWTRRQQQPTTH